MCKDEKTNTQSSEVTVDAELWACWGDQPTRTSRNALLKIFFYLMLFQLLPTSTNLF